MGALGRAFLDQLATPDRDVWFRVSFRDGTGSSLTRMSARDYVILDPGEEALLDSVVGPFFERAVEEGRPLRVLDVGCGVGRHLSYFLAYPERRLPGARVEVFGIENDSDLLPWCRRRFGEEAIQTTGEPFFDEPPFDLVLLLGGNLGIFGSEERTTEGVADLYELLRPNGALLCESSTHSTAEYYCAVVEISYNGIQDRPILWGFATPEWVHRCLRRSGFGEVRHHLNPERLNLTLSIGYKGEE